MYSLVKTAWQWNSTFIHLQQYLKLIILHMLTEDTWSGKPKMCLIKLTNYLKIGVKKRSGGTRKIGTQRMIPHFNMEETDKIDAMLTSRDKDLRKLGQRMCHKLRISYWITAVHSGWPGKLNNYAALWYGLKTPRV